MPWRRSERTSPKKNVKKPAFRKHIPLVCIGASAGGLEAMTALIKSLPPKMNMAFVLIPHLEPHHKSMLAEILSRSSSLDIHQVKNNTKVESAHIYVVPPNASLAIAHNILTTTSRTKSLNGKYLPIDHFMTSLANDSGEKAIGVILSGTGSDGTLGAKAIKAKGGIVFAQDEKTARYYGMPESVIASGSVDYVLEPGAIAEKLIEISTRGYCRSPRKNVKQISEEDCLKKIFMLLRDSTGVDFIHYKRTTVIRRMMRRMAAHNIKSYSGYYSYLGNNPSEEELLCKDILIPVTTFFRDPEMFTALRKSVFPFIIKDRPARDPIRVWVPACSTGEEVYSIVISLQEFLEGRKIRPRIQIFGTDVSHARIAKARAGSYAEDIASHVSAERLKRFFVKTETGYTIAKHIRDSCIFAKQDITSAPPLSNMDIISCRNLFIYLDTYLQNKALSVLHYALRNNGYLVLGTSESVAAAPGLFSVVNNKSKIYSRNSVAQKHTRDSEMPAALSKLFPGEDRRSLDKGHAGYGAGAPFIRTHPAKRGAALPHKPKATEPDTARRAYRGRDIIKMRQELVRTQGRLNAIIEEKDTFNEELKAANEEIQSSNEELQSMNEELETSKEELQSTNEELLTLNEEVLNRNAELTHLHNDLINVFSSMNIPMIIVGNDLRIRRFTPAARKVMNLILTDVERPIGDIKLNIDITNLEEKILDVIETMVQKESEVKDSEGRWYSMRIKPYRTMDNRIDGAVITMIDIDILKHGKDELQDALNYANAILETMREPLLILDKDLRVLSANKSFYRTFRVQMSDVENRLIYELGSHQWDIPKLRELLEDILPKKAYFENLEVPFCSPKIGHRIMLLNGRQIVMHGKKKEMLLLAMEDITERKNDAGRIAVSLREKDTLLKELHHRVNNNMQLISSLLKLHLKYENNENMATILRESQGRIRSIALVHEKIFRTEDYTSVNLHDYVTDLVNGLIDSYAIERTRITPVINVQEVLLKMERAVTCGLIINELVSNAFKYAFPGNRKGKITVSLRKIKKDTIELMVGDDGIGFPENADLKNSATLGLKLVFLMAEKQLDGKIEVGHDEGTRFKITFKKE